MPSKDNWKLADRTETASEDRRAKLHSTFDIAKLRLDAHTAWFRGYREVLTGMSYDVDLMNIATPEQA